MIGISNEQVLRIFVKLDGACNPQWDRTGFFVGFLPGLFQFSEKHFLGGGHFFRSCTLLIPPQVCSECIRLMFCLKKDAHTC